MGWSIGYDENWNRDVGYGVPAYCDHPDCNNEIDRGLSYVCADMEMFGGKRGCGLYFCTGHQNMTEEHSQLCPRCLRGNKPYIPKADHPDWIKWKLTDDSWQQWREEHPEEVEKMRIQLEYNIKY